MSKPKRLPEMISTEFRTWIGRHGYQHRYDICEELGTNPKTLFRMRSGSPIQPEVERLCAMIDLLDEVADVESDEPVVTLAQDLLVKRSGGKVALPVDQGRHAWDLLRANRLCSLAAAVQALACSEADELEELRGKAVEMMDGWRA